MKILSIDTSCDETAVAITEGRRILSNELFSQIETHRQWGGVVPNLAKRAHEERIDEVIERALKNANMTIEQINAIGVTYGPGLAVALGVGINKAKELALKHDKKLIAVNHMEGHIYSCFAQDNHGLPDFEFNFPYLVLLVSGGHTELILFKDHITYEILGQKLDDAAGEALDKGARLILKNDVYPGGPIIETMSSDGSASAFQFPRPMAHSNDLNFSFSGLKTSLLYAIRNMSDKERTERQNDLAASYQEAVFDSLLIKVRKAIVQTGVSQVVVGGGVAANGTLREKISRLVNNKQSSVYFPAKSLYGDNAAMIGIAAYYKAQKNLFVVDYGKLDRIPRASLSFIETF